MLIKAGVDISRLNPEIRRSLNKVGAIHYKYGEEMVITSTYEGNHSDGTLHYANDAYDIRLPKTHRAEIQQEIDRDLGKRFYVKLEANHIHIGYDPK